MIVLKTKNFLYAFILLAYACGQKTKPTDNVETQLDTATQPAKEAVQETKTVNFPCSPNTTTTKKFGKGDNGLQCQITTICLNDNAIIDTLQKSESEIILAQNSNYKHELLLKVKGDSASYTFTKKSVYDVEVGENEVLMNPRLEANTSSPRAVNIYFTLSTPNALNPKQCWFIASIDGGYEFMGFVD